MIVTNQKVVRIDYTLTDPDGTVIDTSKGNGREPLAYLHGMGGIIPGLENALEGKNAGDSLQVHIEPDQAYGHHDPALVQIVPRDRFPKEMTLERGMQFQAQSPSGPRVVTVVDANDAEVRVDANHPLAGVPLHFDVTIVDVRDATFDELQHGHVHGAGGHHH